MYGKFQQLLFAKSAKGQYLKQKFRVAILEFFNYPQQTALVRVIPSLGWLA